MHGGNRVAEVLKAQGVKTLFTLCGGHISPILTGARAAGTALGFYGWLSVINALLFALVMRVVRPGVIGLVFGRKRKLALIGGSASFLAYAIIVWAFTQAPIALVTALRETSIIFAMLFGIVFLREGLNPVKVLATTLTLVGMVLLQLKP